MAVSSSDKTAVEFVVPRKRATTSTSSSTSTVANDTVKHKQAVSEAGWQALFVCLPIKRTRRKQIGDISGELESAIAAAAAASFESVSALFPSDNEALIRTSRRKVVVAVLAAAPSALSAPIPQCPNGHLI